MLERVEGAHQPKRKPPTRHRHTPGASFVLAAQSLMQQNVGTGRRSAPTQEETAHSTPAHAWRKGEVPFLYQIDPQWSEEPYAGGNIHENGCGPTCLPMVYISLTGKTDLDPAAMARFSEQNGFAVDGMTAWALMTDGAAMLGLRSAELPASADAVRAELVAGRPIICSVRPGDFTTTGHFIVLAGLTDDGQVMVRDPNNAGNGDYPWDLDRILGQCANLWTVRRCSAFAALNSPQAPTPSVPSSWRGGRSYAACDPATSPPRGTSSCSQA